MAEHRAVARLSTAVRGSAGSRPDPLASGRCRGRGEDAIERARQDREEQGAGEREPGVHDPEFVLPMRS